MQTRTALVTLVLLVTATGVLVTGSIAAGPSAAVHDLDFTNLRRSGIVDAGFAPSSSSLLQQQCDDDYEPNDSRANAWYLAGKHPDEVFSRVCCEQLGVDLDWFKFTVDKWERVQGSLDELTVNLDLCFHYPNGDEWFCSQSSGTKDESIDATAPSSGDYYAVVYGDSGACDSANDYRFEVGMTAPTPRGS